MVTGHRLILPLAHWPATDRERWEAALRPGSLLIKRGSRVRYRPKSNAKVISGYGRWLRWLEETGRSSPASAPEERIFAEAVIAYVNDLALKSKPSTVLNRLQELHDAAKVMAPHGDWRWIRPIMAWVRSDPTPARDKRSRMVGPRDLYDLGCLLMEMAATASTARKTAMQYRDGLIIALLIARSLRLRNLADLQLQRHLLRWGDEWEIDIPGTETKNWKPIQRRVPAELVPMLETYLTVHRPVLARLHRQRRGPPGDALWISGEGSPMCQGALFVCISAQTRAEFGKPVNPHLFRHIVGTAMAIHDPEHVVFASYLLGHEDLASMQYYNLADGLGAVRRIQRTLIGVRDGSIELPDSDADMEQSEVPAPTVHEGDHASISDAQDDPKHHPGLGPGSRRRLGDLTGQTFGRLAVLQLRGRSRSGKPLWAVRCVECDSEKVLPRDTLLDMGEADCQPCHDLQQLKQEFLPRLPKPGTAAVLGHAGADQSGQHFWHCRCHCGSTFKQPTGRLRWAITEHRLACSPCTFAESEKANTQALLLHCLKEGRAHTWKLKDTYALGLATHDCAHCGRPPQPITLRPADGTGQFQVHANDIERIDSRHGYIMGNVRPACLQCLVSGHDRPAAGTLANSGPRAGWVHIGTKGSV